MNPGSSLVHPSISLDRSSGPSLDHPSISLDRSSWKAPIFPRRFMRQQLPPRDWGRFMTVCIAALSGNTIVAVTDLLFSTEWISSQDLAGSKFVGVSATGRWLAMFSGTPSAVAPICAAVRASVLETPEGLVDLRNAFQASFALELELKIKATILAPYGVDRATFLRKGRAWLGKNKFSEVIGKIEQCTVGVSFLVAGFDAEHQPHIFSLDDSGQIEDHDRMGFHAIGTGSVSAWASLERTYQPVLPVNGLMYRCCEAKFLAESTPTVGSRTVGLIFGPAGVDDAVVFVPEDFENIRQHWQNPPPIPKGSTDVIDAKLQSHVKAAKEEDEPG